MSHTLSPTFEDGGSEYSKILSKFLNINKVPEILLLEMIKIILKRYSIHRNS